MRCVIKLFLLTIMCVGVGGVGAWAAGRCVRVNVDNVDTWKEDNQKTVLLLDGVIDGHLKGFICAGDAADRDYVCDDKAHISILGNAKVFSDSGWQSGKRWVCQLGNDWGWKLARVPDIPQCDDYQKSLENANNAEEVLQYIGTNRQTDRGWATSQMMCRQWRCKDGFKYSGGACVVVGAPVDNGGDDTSDSAPDTNTDAAQKCIDSGGTFEGGKCKCDRNKKLGFKKETGVCACLANHEPHKDGQKYGCVETQKYQEAKEKWLQNRRNQCANSGGDGLRHIRNDEYECICNGDKNLTQNTVKTACVCIDEAAYKFDKDSKKCVMTDAAKLEALCMTDVAKATGADWDDALKKCNCKNPRHIFVDKIGMCAEDSRIVRCENIVGARWNSETGCECEKYGYRPDESIGECVEKDEVRLQRLNGIAGPMTDKIKNLKSSIDVFVAEFNSDRSVWRNKEGKFNTARLASDTVAGVVLGTAGALITSRVIKKNQIKNGMEDYQCVIGGQVVGAFGDEFRVGMR